MSFRRREAMMGRDGDSNIFIINTTNNTIFKDYIVIVGINILITEKDRLNFESDIMLQFSKTNIPENIPKIIYSKKRRI